MKNLFFFSLLFLFTICLSGQTLQDLPDLSSLDSVRIIKRKASPADTVRKIQFVSILSKPTADGQRDTTTTRSPFFDSLNVATLLYNRIYQENEAAAAITYQIFQSNQKNKGVGEYQKAFRRVTGKAYSEETWRIAKAQLVGTWNVAGQNIPPHSATLSDTQVFRRNTPVPQGQTRYSGTFNILSQARLELKNYLTAGTTIILDMIAPGVYMSLDGSLYLSKVTQ